MRNHEGEWTRTCASCHDEAIELLGDACDTCTEEARLDAAIAALDPAVAERCASRAELIDACR